MHSQAEKADKSGDSLEVVQESSTPPFHNAKDIEASKSDEKQKDDEVKPYVVGWRLHVITSVLCICVFLAQMESTITSTSVITITDDLGGFVKNSWILTAYWLTSGAFQIFWAKLSDIIGRKNAMMSAISFFTVFSGACGGSQKVIQLIMFRWLQGIGGCGVLALGQLIFYDLVPPEKYTAYTTLVTSVITSSLVTGPLIGGGITLHGEWRWVFLVNVPVGVTAFLLLGWLFPRPMFNEPAAKLSTQPDSVGRNIIKRLDMVGTVLLLGSCLLLITGLQQAALGYSFSSALVLPLLVCSGPFGIAFFAWQWFITTKRSVPEPIFPWRFFQSRVRVGTILNSWLSGAVVSTCIFQIPQRFMTTNGLSPFSAAARLLAFGAFVPVGSILTGILLRRLRIRPCLLIAFGACLQVVGTVLLSRSSSKYEIDGAQYAYQMLIGMGLGFVIPALIYVLPYTMEKRDLAVGIAIVGQFRMLGGLIAVSIGASITTRYLTRHLEEIIPPQLLGLILERTEKIHLLQDEVVIAAREVFGKAYNLQMYLATGFAVAQLPSTAMMWTAQNYSRLDQDEALEAPAEEESRGT